MICLKEQGIPISPEPFCSLSSQSPEKVLIIDLGHQ